MMTTEIMLHSAPPEPSVTYTESNGVKWITIALGQNTRLMYFLGSGVLESVEQMHARLGDAIAEAKSK